MDLTFTILDGLRQIYALRDAIRRQRQDNRKTYLQMMEIYVELQLSAPVQANPTLQRTATIKKFANAVTSFSSYLQKYHDMHPVLRMFKHTIMEEKRLNIVEEIDQLYRMLNLAAAVMVINGQASASMDAARLFAKLEKMHGDIKLTHDEIHAAMLMKRQHLQMPMETVPFRREPVVEKSTNDRVVVKQPLVRQAPMTIKHVQVAVEEETEDDTSTCVGGDEIKIKLDRSSSATTEEQQETSDKPVLATENVMEEKMAEVYQSVDAEDDVSVVKWEKCVVGGEIQQNESAELGSTTTVDEAEEKESINLQPTRTEDLVSEVAEVEEKQESLDQISQLQQSAPTISDDSTVSLLLELLGSDQTTAYQKEQALLGLIGKCVTNINRVQVYKTKGIPILSSLVHNNENFFTQVYALHCLSWFTFSYSNMHESEFVALQNCVREPTHSEMLSLLHELQHGDEKTKEVATLRCSCLATRGDEDTLRRVGVFPLLINLLMDGTVNQKLWAAEALVTLASDSDESCVAITREGAIPPLVELLRSGTDMHKQEAAYALGNLAANNDLNRAKIAREGAIPPMVAFVKAATDAQNQWAVYALGFLSLGNEENRVLIAQEGGIPPLVALLRAGTRAQKQWSAYTLGNLAHNDMNRMEITLQGAITPLVELLRTGTAMQKQRAAFALGNLVCDNDNVADFDAAILPLVELVRMGSDPQKEDAAYTLGNLAANNDDRRAEIGRNGAIPPLVKLLEIENGDQKQWAAFALRCLAHNNDSNRVVMIENGAIAPLAALMEEGTEAQKEQAAQALDYLVSKSDVSVITFTPDGIVTPLMEYVRAGVVSQNANVAVALNTLGAVREGIIPFFHKLVKPGVETQKQLASVQPIDPKTENKSCGAARAW